MEQRIYFLLGDLTANISTGALAAAVCAWLLSDLPMWLSMPVSMLIGMAIGMVLLYALFLRLFGAMEPMLQTMTTGMFAGMLAVMYVPHGGSELWRAAMMGSHVGIVVFVLIWLLNAAISGPQTMGRE